MGRPWQEVDELISSTIFFYTYSLSIVIKFVCIENNSLLIKPPRSASFCSFYVVKANLNDHLFP